MNKKRQRKIDFIRRKKDEGESHNQLVRRGKFMKMHPKDLQEALGRNIAGGSKGNSSE